MLTLRVEDPLPGVEIEVDVSGEENVFVCGGHGAEEEMLLHDVHGGFVHFFVLVGEAAEEDVHLRMLAWHPLEIVAGRPPRQWPPEGQRSVIRL
jgi:hypothetical protein